MMRLCLHLLSLGSSMNLAKEVSEMHDKVSFKGAERVNAIAVEMEQLVKGAAEPVHPGDTVKSQMRRAWERLGRPAWWRLRAAWYREAGSWSATAVDDFRARAAARHRKAEEAKARERSDATSVLAALREQLATTDPDFHRETIAALDHALGAARREAS